MLVKIDNKVTVTVRDLNGDITDIKVFQNLYTNLLFNVYRDSLAGVVVADDLELKYMAVGSGTTAPAVTDTTLQTETFRKALTSYTTPAIGQVRTVWYIAPAEAVGVIAELGWFAGPLAGAGANSGTLISRLLYSRVKTALESIQVERLDSITEA